MMHAVEPMKPTAGLDAELRALLGADRVRDDAATRSLYSEDIWSAPATPVALIASVQSLDEIVATMKAAFAAGVPVAPRGAGMSYTGSHIPVVADTPLLDLAGMDRVLGVNPADMTVTVEPGCTWASLNDVLRAHGFRTPFSGADVRTAVDGRRWRVATQRDARCWPLRHVERKRGGAANLHSALSGVSA
jgi:FAD/FMN-containing dehydrogenase